MIVKNEEAMLARCLESVKEADEIVVVDTGSIDKTKEVAADLADKISDFEWCDDFAKARNYAKSLCTGDWILSIDADEVLEDDGIAKIKEFLSSYEPKKGVVGIKMKSGNTEYHVVRLFKNSENLFFKGMIHEAINEVAEDKINVTITFGSSPAHILDPERNLRILQKAYEEDPSNPRVTYYLGREFGYKQDWRKCISYLEKYITIATWLPEKADAYFMLAVCYWNIAQGELARMCCLKAMNINANFKAPILLMAHMSFEKNAEQWRKMAETATNEDTLFARENFGII